MAAGMLERWKKRLQKSHVFLNGPALYPPPLLMTRPLREELFLRLPQLTQVFRLCGLCRRAFCQSFLSNLLVTSWASCDIIEESN